MRYRGLMVMGALAALASTAFAQGRSADAKPPFPQIALAQAKSHGQRAIDLLGDRLPEVAAWYRYTPDQFRALLLNDRMMKIDGRGRLFVEDEIDPSMALSGNEPEIVAGQLLPLDQSFSLHSRPGAPRTVYLNFKGALLTNTAWGSGTLTAQPFSIDTTVSTAFSTAELERIQWIWQRVAEDFAPFDVNVTTEQPSADLLTRSGSTDQLYGTTVVITNRTGVYSCSCGGVAYVGAFNDVGDTYKPALVFWDALSSSEKNVAEAITHEAGHNLGLRHDGTATLGYYRGHGTGETGWAPIMGVGYDRLLVQWSKGEYTGANNAEDDYSVMAQTGLPVRVDDHGGTVGTASPMGVTNGGATLTLRAEGVVERPGDVDVFAFTAGAGPVSLSLVGAARSSNLDGELRLLDASGQVLATANPVDGIGALINATLPASGTYYVSVTGVGKGDPLGTGYSNYGSLGLYAVDGTASAASGGVPPVASLTAAPTRGTVPLTVAFNSAGSNDPDGSIVSTEWTFGDGTSGSGASVGKTYTTAGTFTAQLRVTDNSGLVATTSTTITVDPVVVVPVMRVSDIGLTLEIRSNRQGRAVATVTVRDENGNPVAGATVGGAWSGVVSGTASVVTDSAGRAVVASPWTRNSGTFTFRVTGVTRSGSTYNAGLNVETQDSIQR